MARRPSIGAAERREGRGPLTGREPRHRSYGEVALADEVNRLQDPLAELTGKGSGRHDRLRDAALRIGSLVGGDELRYEQGWEALCRAGRDLRLSETDVRRTVEWGLRHGMENPRAASAWRDVADANDARLRWLEWWEAIDPADFPGSKGSTLLRVLAAFALTGMAVGKVDLGMSIRQAAEAAGLSTSTVWPMLKRGGTAERTGLLRAITRVKPGSRTAAAAMVWRPASRSAQSRDTRRKPGDSASGCIGNARMGPPLSPTLNIWHRRSNAWRIAQHLEPDEDTTVADLARAAGLHPATVRRALGYLASLNLAERVDWTHWRRTLARPDANIPAADGTDHASRRRQRHAQDRDHYRKYLAARAVADEECRAHQADLKARLEHGPAEGWWDPDELVPMFDPETGEVLGAAAARGGRGPSVRRTPAVMRGSCPADSPTSTRSTSGRNSRRANTTAAGNTKAGQSSCRALRSGYDPAAAGTIGGTHEAGR